MTPDKLTSSSISIVIKTYFGVLDMLPELMKMLTEYNTSSYYLEHLLKEINHTGNMAVIAAEDIAVRPLEIKLQEKKIPFQIVPSQDFSDHINSSGRYLFLIRESDHGKATEAAEEVKKELSPEMSSDDFVSETVEEHTLSDNFCISEPEDMAGEPEETREALSQSEEAHSEKINGLSRSKSGTKKKRGHAIDESGLSRAPEPVSDRTSVDTHAAEHKANYRTSAADITDASKKERLHPAEKKEAAQTTLNKSADFHNGRVDTGSSKTEYTEPDQRNSRQGNPRQYRPASKPEPNGAVKDQHRNRHLHKQGTSPHQLQQKDRNGKGTISILGNGLDIRTIYDEKKSGTPAPRMGCAAASGSLHSNSAKRFEHGHSKFSLEGLTQISQKDILKTRHFHDALNGTMPLEDGRKATSSPQNDLYGNVIHQPPNRYFITKMAAGQEGAPLNVTNQILKERRRHSVHDVLASRYFTGTLFMARHSVSQTVFDQETEAGRVFNSIEDFTSPIGRYAKSKYLAHGAIALNKDINCNAQIFLAAYATKHGCDVESAQQVLMKAYGLKELLGSPGRVGVYLQDLEELRNAVGKQGFIGIFNGFTNQGLANFIQYADISEELKKALLGYSKKALNDPNVLSKLLRQFTDRTDQECLQMMYGSVITRHIGRGMSLSSLFRGNLIQILKRVSRNSDAGRAATSLYYSGQSIYGAYRAGIRLIMTVLDKSHITGPSLNTRLILTNPAGVLKKHTFHVMKHTAGKAVQKAAITRFGRSVRMISRCFSRTLMSTRVVNHTIGSLKTLNMLRQGIHAAVMNTRLMVNVTQVGKLAAQLAAKAGAALGWIAAVVIIVILLLEIGQGLINSKVEDSGAVNHIYAQDTEIIQEIMDELSAKNEAFIIDINNAANHRGNYAVNSGFKADEGVSFYEEGAYHVVFRDFYGNELEPAHVDLNNTKAIISMATKFMPYPFTKLSANASEEEKKAYEEIKQHFKDYCNYLWASTHQISIEEYHPGDSSYSHVDTSSLVTELSTGKCEKDGSFLWLTGDFQPNMVGGSSCGLCQEAETTRLGPYNDDLCSHGNDKNPHGGWRMTGKTVQHINCPYGHEHHDDDNSWTEYCEIGYVQNRTHIHTCYEWIYECGGHMGSVVYVTIGDLSRIPEFGPAGDVDYGAAGVYDTAGTEHPAGSADPEEDK